MSNITVTKGKILQKKIQIIYKKKVEGEESLALVDETHKALPHEDLRNAFARLDIHAALLGEFIPLTQVSDVENPDESIVSRFHVSGFTRVGIDDDEGVILTAQKTLHNGKVLIFNTPTARFNDTSDEVYPFMDQLMNAIENAVVEMELYLGGKYAIDPQGKLELDN